MKKQIVSLLLCAVLLLGLGAALPASAAHTHSYTETVQKAQIGKSGKRVRTCTICGKQKKTVIPAVKKIALQQKSFVYDGKRKTPAVTVLDKTGNALKKGADYKVGYSAGRKSIGVYTVRITLRGSYKGSKTLRFKILPKAPEAPKAAAVTAESVTLQWKAVKGATGYVVYRYDAAKNGWQKLRSTKNPAFTVKNLAPKTAYVFAVRACAKTANGNLFSAYSAKTPVTTAAKAPALQYPAVQKILESKVYTAQITFDEMPDATYRLSRRGEDYYMKMSLKEDGETYQADIYYDSTDNKVYGQMLGIWFEMDDEEMRQMAPEMDIFRLVDLNDPVSVEAGSESYAGKPCAVETVTAKSGTVTKLWFQNGKLVRIGLQESGQAMHYCKISAFSGTVGKMEKPKHPIKLEV